MIVSDPDLVDTPTTAAEDAASIHNSFRDEQIRHLAYELWERRNCPIGEPEVDWFKAKVILFGLQEG